MTPNETNAAQAAINRVYQDILAQRESFPEYIREIFHNHINRLTGPIPIEINGKQYQEIQVSWSEATPEERSRWACYQQTHVKRFVEIKKEEVK